jgi:ATP-binding cassette, subfamily C, bacterial
MRLLLVLARRYPRRTLATLVCLILAGLADGIGVSSVLPLMRLAMPSADVPSDGSAATALEARVIGALHSVGLEPTAGTLFAMVFVGLVFKAVLLLIAYRQVGYAVARTATSLRLDLIRALLATRWEYYVHQPLGVVANSVSIEAQQAADAYLRSTMIGAAVVQSIVYVAVGCLVSWQMTLGAIAGGIVIGTALSRLIRTARKAGKRQVKLSRLLLTRLTDTLQAVKPLKAMAREPLIAPVLEAEVRGLNRAVQREVISTATLESLQEPLIVMLIAAGLYVAVAVMAMPLADVMILAFLCARVLGGMGRVQKEYQRMAIRESAFWSLHGLTERARAAVEVPSGGLAPALRSDIRFADVGFRYAEDWVLRDATLRVPAGSLTVITGPSGAGKTTVADLMIGLLQPTEGTVFIDGVPLPDLDTRRWRELIGYVPQETMMLHDTVSMNVTLGDHAVSPEAVAAALRAAGAWDFVSALPEGLNTIVGERGLRLSGGQRQRLALARALVRRPALLLLDEATTALDPATERSICDTLRGLAGSLTLVAICHHGHLVEIADHVYRVANCRITPVSPVTRIDKTAAR